MSGHLSDQSNQRSHVNVVWGCNPSVNMSIYDCTTLTDFKNRIKAHFGQEILEPVREILLTEIDGLVFDEIREIPPEYFTPLKIGGISLRVQIPSTSLLDGLICFDCINFLYRYNRKY
jgi:hypothetical protein